MRHGSTRIVLGLLVATSLGSLSAEGLVLIDQFGASSPMGLSGLTYLCGDQAYGPDVGWTSCHTDVTWTHTYDASAFTTIAWAVLHMDILDGDNGELDLFHDLEAIGSIHAPGGCAVGPSYWYPYETHAWHFTIGLPASRFQQIMTGSFTITGVCDRMGIWGSNLAVLSFGDDPKDNPLGPPAAPVPEPGAFVLLSLGVLGAGLVVRRGMPRQT